MERAGWVQERDMSAASRRLFCLPHAGSGSAGYYRWKRLLPAAGICPVHLPGRDLKREHPAISDGITLVQHLHEEMQDRLDRPYAIFGHSMGALLAFAWAQRIQAAGLRQPDAVFLSGRAPHRRAGIHAETWLRADDDTLLRMVDERFGGNSYAALQDPEMRAAFLPVLRADLQVVESLPIDGTALTAPVYAICGDADASVNEQEMRTWQTYASGRFATATFAGGHFYHFSEGEAALLQWLASEMSPAS